MAMFGNKWADMVRPKYGTPGIGDGIPGNTPIGGMTPLDIPQMDMPQGAAPPQEQSGRIKPSVMGIIADALAGAAGMAPSYAPMLMQRQQRQQQRSDSLADYERKRSDEWDMWQRQQDYERANPKPINNDTVNDFNFIASQIGPDAAKSYLQNLADGPPVAVDVANPDGSVTRQFLPRSSMMSNQPKGGDPVSSGPQGGHLTFDQYKSMSQGMDFGSWQKKFGTPVLLQSESEFNALPKGMRFVGPDGIVRMK